MVDGQGVLGGWGEGGKRGGGARMGEGGERRRGCWGVDDAVRFSGVKRVAGRSGLGLVGGVGVAGRGGVGVRLGGVYVAGCKSVGSGCESSGTAARRGIGGI
jgi:hypothetical protein